ncbi:MAG: hypothetical protein AAF632_12740 [Bacteroidota bacterium]
MNTKLKVLIIISAAFFSFMLPALRPVNVDLDDSRKVSGQLLSIKEADGLGDVSLTLKDDKTDYYINRGALSGLNIGELQKMLTHKQVTIFHADHWTPLDPFGRKQHIIKLVKGDETIYDETARPKIATKKKS